MSTPRVQSSPSIPWSALSPADASFTSAGEGGFGTVVRAKYGSKSAAVKLLRIDAYKHNDSFAEALEQLAHEVDAQQSAITAILDKSDSASNNYVVHVWGMATGPPTDVWLRYLGHEEHRYVRRAPTGSGRVMVGIVMSWEGGGTLHEAIHASKGQTRAVWAKHADTAEKLRVLSQLAHALYALHFAPTCIVHGDLKPANVLLSKPPTAGEANFTAKLADFGLAKLKEAHSTVHAATSFLDADKSIAGTRLYMAPEQFGHVRRNAETGEKEPRPGQPPSRRTDVYAFGVIMWEVLTGRLPWDGVTQDDMVTFKREGCVPSVGKKVPKADYPLDMPASVRELICGCCDENYKQRPRMDKVRSVLAQAHSVLCKSSYDIFLSYAWGDDKRRQPLALAIHAWLVSAGYKVWMDLHSMGCSIQDSMKGGIERSSMAVILASPEYVDSANCKTEWTAILDQGKPYLVVNVDEYSPFEWCSEKRSFFQRVLKPKEKLFVDLHSLATMEAGPGNGPSDEMYVRLAAKPNRGPMIIQRVKELLKGSGAVTVASKSLSSSLEGLVLPPPAAVTEQTGQDTDADRSELTIHSSSNTLSKGLKGQAKGKEELCDADQAAAGASAPEGNQQDKAQGIDPGSLDRRPGCRDLISAGFQPGVALFKTVPPPKTTVGGIVGNVVLLGDTSVGKTSLIRAWMDEEDSHTLEPTTTTHHSSVVAKLRGAVCAGVHVLAQVMDTPGRRSYRSAAPSYLRGVQVVLLVFNAADPDSLKSLQEFWIPKCDKYLPTGTSVPIVLVMVHKGGDVQVSAQQAEECARAAGAAARVNISINQHVRYNRDVLALKDMVLRLVASVGTVREPPPPKRPAAAVKHS